MSGKHLLIIDPQNDFCDLPADFCPANPLQAGAQLAPSLPVTGAHQDMLRLAALIDQAGSAFDAISITLDSHQRLDIAHPTFWQTGDGAAVNPFTLIRADDVQAGRYLPRDARATPRALAYMQALEATGRYVHMVWPVHCEIGSWGHAVHASLRAAYNRWEDAQLKIVAKISKGTNPWTEHYSAIQAEVPDPDDDSTQINTALIATVNRADTIYIAGEAGSHCVKASTEHIVANLADGAARIVIITDCISAVTGFEAQYQAFLADMRAKGARLMTAEEVARSFN